MKENHVVGFSCDTSQISVSRKVYMEITIIKLIISIIE